MKVRKLAYRQRFHYENLNKAIFDGVGQFGIPQLLPEHIDVDEFIGFNYAKSCKNPRDKGIHFFIDDYQFARLWSRPVAYMNLLRGFRCVCTPDFSLYVDFPKAIQIYNHYRKHWLGAYWQMHGMTVIPTISWGEERSYEWCFDGEPEGGDIAVSSVGTQANAESRRLFMLGYNEMLRRLQPSQIYFYGSIPDECKGNVVHLAAYQDKFAARKEGA